MKRLIICLAIVAMGVQYVSAQRLGPEQRERLEQRIEAQRIAFITSKLELTAEESEKFWPVYNAFKKDQKAKRDAIRPDKRIDELSEEEAAILIDKHLDMEIEMVEIKREYFKQLSDILTPKKVMKLNRVELEFNRSVLEKLRDRKGGGPGPGGGPERN